jgi:uncharacterized protein YkwD
VARLEPVSTAPASSGDPTTLAAQLLNAERSRNGLASLAWQPGLAASAADYAADMAATGYFSHTAVDGSTLRERSERHGYVAWIFLGENLAVGQSSPEQVVQAWMRSPAHRANALSGDACDIGVGHASGPTPTLRGYWVMEIGCSLLSSDLPRAITTVMGVLRPVSRVGPSEAPWRTQAPQSPPVLDS